MKKGILWRKSLMAAGLGMSVVMSSLSSAPVAVAAEYETINEAPEATEKGEETKTGETEEPVNKVNDTVKIETSEVKTETEAKTEEEAKRIIEEAKNDIKDAGVILDDTDLDKVAGGWFHFGW